MENISTNSIIYSSSYATKPNIMYAILFKKKEKKTHDYGDNRFVTAAGSFAVADE